MAAPCAAQVGGRQVRACVRTFGEQACDPCVIHTRPAAKWKKQYDISKTTVTRTRWACGRGRFVLGQSACQPGLPLPDLARWPCPPLLTAACTVLEPQHGCPPLLAAATRRIWAPRWPSWLTRAPSLTRQVGPGGHDLCRACLWASNSCDGAGCASGSAANAWLHRLCSSGTHFGWHYQSSAIHLHTCQLSLLPAPACPTVAAGCVHVSWRKGTIVLPPCLAAASTDRISSAGVPECRAAAVCTERVPTCCSLLQVDLPVLTWIALASRLPAGAPLPCWCRTGCEVAASGRQQRANTGSNACFFNAPLASATSSRAGTPTFERTPPIFPSVWPQRTVKFMM